MITITAEAETKAKTLRGENELGTYNKNALKGNLEESLIVVRRLLNNEAPELLLGVLRSNVSRWMACKVALAKGLDDSSIVKVTNIPKFLLNNIKTQCKTLSVSYLRYLCFSNT